MKTHHLTLTLLLFWNLSFARTWTNTEGKTIEATFIELDGDNVKLRLDKNYTHVNYPLSGLIKTDRAYINQLVKEQEEQRQQETLANRKAKWHDNYDEALAEAQELNFPLLMLFTGSDWCYYCIELEKNVFSKPDFKEFANQNLVLLKLDFPRAGVKSSLKKHHLEHKEHFEVSGYPTTFYLNTKGKQIARWGGYGGDSVNTYLTKVQKKILPKL